MTPETSDEKLVAQSAYKDETIATIRSTYNPALAGSVLLLLNRFLGWNLSLEDLVPYAPALAVGYGVFYRLSLWASTKSNFIGYVLFAKDGVKPIYAKVVPKAIWDE
jgi:hypothetical protein